MKRLLLVLFIVATVFTSCQTKTNDLPADLTAAKVAVTKVLDTHWSAVKAKDADAVIALLTDDALSCGTDSKEFWNKTDMYNSIRPMFADTSFKIDITIDKRLIRIAKDGNSAIALEQMFMKPFSKKIPVRNIYHLVKINDIWKIDFTSVGFIPDNEDIGKLNKALE
jgi:ketosteroid isomerase-like protein